MPRYSQCAALDALARRCVSEGWTVEHTKGDHLRWTAPNGNFVFSASTPSDQRGYRNHIAYLRRAWPEWRPPEKRDTSRHKRTRVKAGPARGRIYFGAGEPVHIPVAEMRVTLAAVWPVTLAAVWPADDMLTMPKPPTLW